MDKNGPYTSLPSIARDLRASREVLQQVESSALAGVAASLSAAAESLAATAERLEASRPKEWMTPQQAAEYLGITSVGSFEQLVSRQDIPKHYVSERLPRYSRHELDRWLAGR